jgi:hypothetical protein
MEAIFTLILASFSNHENTKSKKYEIFCMSCVSWRFLG